MTFRQLVQYSDPKRLLRADDVTGPPLKISTDENSMFYAFNFRSHITNTTGQRHHGYIKFLKPNRNKTLDNLDIVCDCTCFSGDTLVLMSTGEYKKISEIRQGDSVYTHKGRVKKVIGNVERNINKRENVYEIKVEGFPLPIVATGNHPFYAYRGRDTCACGCGNALPDITTNESYNVARLDRMYLTGHQPAYNRVSDETIEKAVELRRIGKTFKEIAEECKVSRSTASNISSGRTRIRKDDTYKEASFKWVKVDDFRSREWFLSPWLEEGAGGEIDPLLARFLGYYASDGCLRQTSMSFAFHTSEENTLGKDVKDIVQHLFEKDLGIRLPDGRYTTRTTLTHTGYHNKPHHKRKMQGIAINCCITPEFKKFVQDHVGEGSWNKKLSQWLLNKGNETARQFLTGLFLGDGHVKKTGAIRWGSVSKNLVWNVSTLLSRLHIRHVITPVAEGETQDEKNGVYAIDISHAESAKKVFDWMAPYMRDIQLKRRSVYPDNLNQVVDEGCLTPLISRNKVNYSGTVWDLCVEDDHSFIVHGVVCSNCPDYKFRWAWANKQKGAGVVGPKSMNRAWNQAPRVTNPRGIPGLCKHILSMKDYLRGVMSPAKFANNPKQVEKEMHRLMRYADQRWTTPPQGIEPEESPEATLDAKLTARRLQKNRGELPNLPEPNKGPEAPELPEEVDVPEMPETNANALTVPNLPNISNKTNEPNTPKPVVKPPDMKKNESMHELHQASRLCNELCEELEGALTTSPSGDLTLSGEANTQSPEDQALSALREIRDFMGQAVGFLSSIAAKEAQEAKEEKPEGGAPEIPEIPEEDAEDEMTPEEHAEHEASETPEEEAEELDKTPSL